MAQVPPGGSAHFAWEQLVARPTLDLHVGRARRTVCLDDLQAPRDARDAGRSGRSTPRLRAQARGTIHAEAGAAVRYSVLADGPTKVLHVRGARFGGIGSAGESSPNLAEPSMSVADDGRLRAKVALSVANVGFSLIDSSPRELLYLSAAGVKISYTASAARGTLSVQVSTLQADNQLARPTFPVLLRPHWSESDRRSRSLPPALELLVQTRAGAEGLVYYETVSLRLQTLELMLDTVLVSTLALFSLALYADMCRLLNALLGALGVADQDDRATPSKVYMRWLNIQPLRVLLTCRSVAGVHGLAPLTDKKAPAGAVLASSPSPSSQPSPQQERRPRGAGALGLINSASTLVTNIDRAPLKLRALVLDNAFAPPAELASSISAYYQVIAACLRW